MPDIKEAESKASGISAAVGQANPGTAEKSPKAKTRKARVPSAAKAAKPKKPAASAAAIAAPVVSKAVRKNYSQQERAQKLSEIQKLVGAGESVKGATKKAGISEQTYYQWKKPVAKKGQSDDLKDLVKLEAENAQLKKLLAERLRKENADLKKKLGL